ncbi:MAG: hypothetical protein FWC45_09390, partial [Treponema sp.]|nr:hypothetical protein [Treponema sp.]
MKILIADPAKNITVFILEPVETPAERRALAMAILADTRLRAEQVGFVTPPSSGKAAPGTGAPLWRLDMAGGEFCGNAARSFGLYVARMMGLTGRT